MRYLVVLDYADAAVVSCGRGDWESAITEAVKMGAGSGALLSWEEADHWYEVAKMAKDEDALEAEDAYDFVTSYAGYVYIDALDAFFDMTYFDMWLVPPNAELGWTSGEIYRERYKPKT